MKSRNSSLFFSAALLLGAVGCASMNDPGKAVGRTAGAVVGAACDDVTLCDGAELCCAGVCVDSDNANCGACGTACQGATICVAGATCGCADPAQTQCGNACVDVTADSSHCGTCDTACAGATTCVAGVCARPAAALAPALGTAGNFVILSKSGISTVPPSAITGDIGVSPAAGTYITGFSLTADFTGEFSTSLQVTGNVYAADDALPTPTNLTTAIGDMELAYTDAAARAPDVIELGAGDIGGMTLTPGVYQWSSSLLIPTDLTLSGSDTDVWIFQIAGDLTMSSATRVVLAGGAVPKNIFWQVAGAVELGTTSHFEGVLLTETSVALRTGATVNGRLLAKTDVSLDGNAVTHP